MNAESGDKSESCVVVNGVGLIGGSIAAALRARNPECRIIGMGRNPARLESARRAGLLDECISSTGGSTLPSDALFVLCLPVELIAPTAVAIASAVGKNAVITDAGSVKAVICRDVARDAAACSRFVGAHPVAGSEQTGFEHSSPDLFAGRWCFLTPEQAPHAAVERVSEFWSSLGCRMFELSADAHDRIVAATSHLPHAVAAMTTLCQDPESLRFAGTGFRDTTRVAAGDPGLWTQILLGNATHVQASLRVARSLMQELEHALEQRDAATIHRLLQTAAQIRRGLS